MLISIRLHVYRFLHSYIHFSLYLSGMKVWLCAWAGGAVLLDRSGEGRGQGLPLGRARFGPQVAPTLLSSSILFSSLELSDTKVYEP